MTDGVVILRGDVRDIAATLDAEIFDGCLCDPPYGLSFMGKKWDYDVPSVETWEAVLGALKPGAHLLAFAGTRTQHRMAVRIEDAGFEIRDMIAWVYGSGFPKSLDVSKAIDKAAGAEREVLGVDPVRFARLKNQISGSVSTGEQWEHGGRDVTITAPATEAARQWQGWGTALKPALEPITVARKPLRGTVAANVLAFGTGALNVDGCRVGTRTHNESGWSKSGSKASENRSMSGANYEREPKDELGLGRWPANLIHDGSEEVVAGFPETTSGAVAAGTIDRGKDALRLGAFGGREMPERAIDSGSAARFFYCAKASRSEREAGLDRFAASGRTLGHKRCARCGKQKVNRPGSECKCSEPEWVAVESYAPTRNHHPTVKPIALAEYLARLILPPKRADGKPRRLLVPFSGSGSEIIGALRAGWDEVVGIELSPEYAEIAEARIAHWTACQQDLAL